MTNCHYAAYDSQLGGFKAQMSFKTYEEAVDAAADRAICLAEGCNEELPSDVEKLTSEEICEIYGYEIRVISVEDSEKINESEEVGLLTTVSGL